MTRQDDDRAGAKPYKTYKAGRGRRSQLDDELAGARPARTRPPPTAAATAPPRTPAVGQGVPHVRPGAGERRKSGAGKAGKGAGPAPAAGAASAGGTSPSRFSSSSSPGWSPPSWPGPGYQTFDRAVNKANNRVGTATRAQLAPTTAGSGARPPRVLIFGLDATPARRRTPTRSC